MSRHVIDIHDHILSARKIMGIVFKSPREGHHYRGSFWIFSRGTFKPIADELIRGYIWLTLEESDRVVEIESGKTKRIAVRPKQSQVNSILSAMKAVCAIDDTKDAPFWLPGAPPDLAALSPRDFISVANGLLHVPTNRLYPHTPTYFNLYASDIRYDPGVPRPTQWHKFLDEIFATDIEAKNTLQDWFGYNLTPDTSLQKIMLIVGPRRGGKGTIGRILRLILGSDSVAALTLASLGETFGLQHLIGRPACIVPDARFSKRMDPAIIAERLLSISGEDAIPINRKFLGMWNGSLPTRFTIFTNELPAIADVSGALLERFVLIKLTKTFAGHEDPTLFDRLSQEASGILNWAIVGYQRLREQGRFRQPVSSIETAAAIRQIGSPISDFLDERCEVRVGISIEKGRLFNAWENWCLKHRMQAGSIQTFGRDLRAILPELGECRPAGGSRARLYTGVCLVEGVEEQSDKIVAFKPGPYEKQDPTK
jgi:putative DNA primase/helicase